MQPTLPVESLLPLIEGENLEDLLRLAQTDKRLNTFLNDPYVLQQIAFAHELPVPDTILQAKLLKRMDPSHRLAFAASRGDIEYVTRMIDTEITDYDPPLRSAAEAGNEEILLLLLDRSTLKGRDEALIAASNEGHDDIAKTLLEAGTSKSGRYRALNAAAKEGRPKIVRMIDAFGPKARSLLVPSVYSGDSKTLQTLLDSGVLKKAELDGALVLTQSHKETQIVDQLIRAGARPTGRW